MKSYGVFKISFNFTHHNLSMRISFLYIVLLFSNFIFAQKEAQLDSLLIQGIEARSNKEYQASLEILSKVRSIAEEKKMFKQQFLALNNIGANYYSMLDYGEALNNYLDAYTIALKNLDDNEEMVVLNNIAILYSKEGDYIKANEYFKKAYDLALKLDNNLRIGIYAINIGIVYNKQNKLDEAATFLEIAKEKLIDDPDMAILVDLSIAQNLYQRGELQKAKSLAKSILPQLDSKSLSEEKLDALILLSKITAESGSYQTSIPSVDKFLEDAKNPESKLLAYKQLADVYQKSNLYKKAIEAMDSVVALTESVNNLKNGKLYETNRVKFEIADYQRELKLNKELRIKERNTLYILLGFSVLIIILITWALRNSYIKFKQRKILHQRSKEIIELELKKKETNNLLLEKQLQAKETMNLLVEERLKNEIETRNRKLAAKALQTSAKNELLNDVINTLSEQTEVLKNKFLTKKIRQLKSLLKSDREWESFFTHFEAINHGFLTAIKKKHPELTSNDIRYISYLYMDLSNKEISSLFNITAEASRKRKERIKSKIGLGSEDDLYSYISSL